MTYILSKYPSKVLCNAKCPRTFVLNNAEFEESKHKRDEKGQFSSNGNKTGKTERKEKSGKSYKVSPKKQEHEKKGISNIHNYITNELKKMGFDIETSGSGLSDSEYITINNWEEKTGKEGANSDGTYKIRISNHDLPPSYDKLHGYFDSDITDGIKQRNGSEGTAESYVSALEKIAETAKKEVPTHIKELIKQQEKNKEQQKKAVEQYKKDKTEKEKKYESYYSLAKDEKASIRKKVRKELHTNPEWEKHYRTLLGLSSAKRRKYYKENYDKIKSIENKFAEDRGLPPNDIQSDMIHVTT